MMQKNLILAVETSGRIGSVAVATGEKILAQAFFPGVMRHSAEIFPTIRTLLERFGRTPREINQVYISLGPGSFTGLRIAVALAKSMHLANGAKIVAPNTLDVIAANADDYINQENADVTTVACVLDAKRGQFFVAAYERNCGAGGAPEFRKILPDCLMAPRQLLERFEDRNKPIWLLGEGLVYYKDKFSTEGVRFLPENYWSPQASKVYLLGWKMASEGNFADPLTLEPIYLRRPEAEEKWQQREERTKR